MGPWAQWSVATGREKHHAALPRLCLFPSAQIPRDPPAIFPGSVLAMPVPPVLSTWTILPLSSLLARSAPCWHSNNSCCSLSLGEGSDSPPTAQDSDILLLHLHGGNSSLRTAPFPSCLRHASLPRSPHILLGVTKPPFLQKAFPDYTNSDIS